jgi:hypothetical protein
VDRLYHPLEHRVEELARLLRITVSEQFHRTLEIREEDGHLLALAFDGCPGGEDLLGQMLWRVGLRGRKAMFRRSDIYGARTLRAEFSCR